MLVRDIKRLLLVVGPLLVLLFLSVGLWDTGYGTRLQTHVGAFFTPSSPEADHPYQRPDERPLGLNPTSPGHTPGHDNEKSHHEVFSLSTPDKKYFPIKFGNLEAFNPNIIPHPTKDDTYIIVGQKVTEQLDPIFTFFEIACEAVFLHGSLQCLDHVPMVLPVAHTLGPPSNCEKETGITQMLGLNKGPHDARLAYSPSKPLLLFGSNSAFTCFGIWVQDFRVLMGWPLEEYRQAEHDDFVQATELQRPPPYSGIEKNWFLFWDRDNIPYAHFAIFPTRVFAQLILDGSAGEDLGPFAAEQDEKCLAHYLPELPPMNESIHQATNSLRVTMCHRANEGCTPTEDNTVLITIIQHKKYYHLHGEYEPYVVAFRDRSPFEIVGISKKPLWIHGRKFILDGSASEMFYVVSMNWKKRGLNYHGYLDDELMLAFGVEDKGSGGIDLLAGDLLAGLGLCSEV